jgi:hypothetical protein
MQYQCTGATRSVLIMLIGALLLVGCQTEKHGPPTFTAFNPPRKFLYDLDQSFRDFFGAEGIVALNSAIQQLDTQPNLQLSRAPVARTEPLPTIYFKVDQNFLNYFGSEGIFAVQKALRDLNPRAQIQPSPE